MPKVSEQYRDDRKREIAEAAMRVFERKGFQRTSMADIITEAGLSAGAIYGHYESKHEIMLAVASRILGERTEDFDAVSTMDPIPDPGEILARMLRGLSAQPGTTRLLVQAWGEVVIDPQLRDHMNFVAETLRTTYWRYLVRWATHERSMETTEAEQWASDLAPVLLGLGQGFIAQSALFVEFDAERYLATASALLRNSI